MTRLAAAVLAAAVGGVAAPATAARPLPPCLAFADAAGDAGPGGVAAAGDPSLDLTRVRFATVDRSLVAQLTVAAYADRAPLAVGNRYEAVFSVDGKRVEVFWRSGPLREHEAEATYQQGIRVNGSFVSEAVTGSVRGDVVTISVKLATLKAAVGVPVDGETADDVVGRALASYHATNPAWDTAVGPDTGFVIGRACR